MIVSVIITVTKDGERIEKDWKELTEHDQQLISCELTHRFMKAAGYRAVHPQSTVKVEPVI